MEQNTNNADRILRLKSVCNQTGLSRSSVYLAITKNTFPKPIRLGSRSVGWLESEITAWVKNRIEQTRGAAA